MQKVRGREVYGGNGEYNGRVISPKNEDGACLLECNGDADSEIGYERSET